MDKLKAILGRKGPDLTLDQVKTILGLSKVSLADLETAAARADALAAEAVADCATLAAARPGLLISGTDAEIADHDMAAGVFSRAQDRAKAIGGAIRERIAVAREAEAEAGRLARYDAAAALVPKPADIERDYREMVRLGRSIVERFGRAAEAARAVNADLPAGRPGLPHPEGFRQMADEPAKVVKAKRMWLYVDEAGRPIEDQSKVQPRWSVDAEGRPLADKSKPQRHPADLGFAGHYRRDSYGQEVRKPGNEVYVRRWQFVECETVETLQGRVLDAFARELKIPALHAMGPVGWNMDGMTDLGSVLDVLARADTRPPAPTRAAPVSRTLTLENFERVWGPLAELDIKVEDGTAEASRRHSSNPLDDFDGAVATGYVRGGHGSGDGPRATPL